MQSNSKFRAFLSTASDVRTPKIKLHRSVHRNIRKHRLYSIVVFEHVDRSSEVVAGRSWGRGAGVAELGSRSWGHGAGVTELGSDKSCQMGMGLAGLGTHWNLPNGVGLAGLGRNLPNETGLAGWLWCGSELEQSSKSGWFPLAETTFALAEATFPSAETTFPLAEATFPLVKTIFPGGVARPIPGAVPN